MKQKIIATNDTIKQIIKEEIKKYGLKADLNHIDVSQVTNMYSLFFHSDFNGDISKWDVSNVTNMNALFCRSKFNGDISQWNVSNVKDMQHIFAHSCFNNDISKWDVSNVDIMAYMFAHSKFNQDISQWDVSNVKNFFAMFGFSEFNQDISKWNPIKAISTESMFLNSKFRGNISNWKMPHVQFMNKMFNLLDFQCLKNFSLFRDNVNNKKALNGLFELSLEHTLSKKFLSNFKDFVKQHNITIFDYQVSLIHYAYSPYSFLICETFENSKQDTKENFSSKLKTFQQKFINLNHFQYFNLDSLLFDISLQNKKLDLYFSQNHRNAFSLKQLLMKLDELLSISDKKISDLVLVQYLIDRFFELEKEFIYQKDEMYINYLKQNHLSFSDFYPYYSTKQKQELLQVIKNSEFNKCFL